MRAGRTASPSAPPSSSTLSKSPHRASPDLRRSVRSPLSKGFPSVKTTTVTLKRSGGSPKPSNEHRQRASPTLRSGSWRASDYQNVDKLLKEAEDISCQMALRATRPPPEAFMESNQRKTLVARVIQRIRQSAGSACDPQSSRLSDSVYVTASVDTPSLKATDWEEEGSESSIRKPPKPVPEENSPARELPEDEIFTAVSPVPYSQDENRPPSLLSKSLRPETLPPDYKTLYEALQIRFRDEQVTVM